MIPAGEEMTDPARNQRRYDRRDAKIPASLEFEWGSLEGTIENIAEGGIFFVTETLEGAVIEGDRLNVRFSDDRGSTRSLGGAILRVERYFHDGDLYRAFAVRFDEPYREPSESR
jgi:hypothetical protein